MKAIKQILANVMAIATFSCISIIPTNAIILDENLSDSEKSTALQEAVFIVDDGEYSATYYFKYDEYVWSAITKPNGEIVGGNFPIKEVTDDFDTSTVDTVINVTEENSYFLIDTPYGYYTHLYYDFYSHSFYMEDSSIPKETTLGDSEDTIGDSVETVGGSDTGIRGDVNYDGKVNVSDLIYLRRYLLHLIKW